MSVAPTDVMSVGQRMKDVAVYGVSHPAYRAIADAVTAEVLARAKKELDSHGRAVPTVMTYTLSPELAGKIGQDFPEFRLVNFGMDRVVHLEYQAYAHMANELMLHYASRMAVSVVHVGGSLLSSLLVPGLDVHVEVDVTQVSAIHERHRDARNTLRIFGDYAKLMQEGDFSHARPRYERYLARENYLPCTSQVCSRRADVYCVDVARNAMSPTQFVAGAIQTGAEVAFAMFPFHPVMLISDEGEIPGTGVWFVKDRHIGELRLKYPEGVCGAEKFSLADWAAWLSEHVVAVGKGKARLQYHFQLLKRRGPFMLVQATRAGLLPAPDNRLRHALDLELTEEQYVVTGRRLINLAADPNKAESWGEVRFMAPKKIVDAVYKFGMALTPENFSRYAVRRQFTLYDRVTLEGSTVTFGYRPTADELDVLTSHVYALLFSKRYESGQLSKELMARLKAVAGFAEAGTMARIKAVATWCIVQTWQKTFGALIDMVGQLGTWLERRFATGKDTLSVARFDLAPSCVLFETVVQQWKKSSRGKYRHALEAVTQFHKGNAVQIRGGLLAEAIADHAGGRSLRSVDKCLLSVLNTKVVLDDTVKSKTLTSDVEVNPVQEELINTLKTLNAMDTAGERRHVMDTEVVERMDDPEEGLFVDDQDVDPDYVGTMNEVYEAFNPGMNAQHLERDVASLSMDPQDRQLYADKLRMPRLFELQPKDKWYYRSKVLALGAPKRQETGPELLSAAAARNLAAPVVRLPQDDSTLIPEIWENFLNTMCVSGAREKLAYYQSDPVGLEETAYRDWMAQARPEVIARVARELKEYDTPALETDVGRYIMMLKADVKPPLSAKPMTGRIESQVIVYHDKPISSMYSSIFRVLVRRFLSLLKPNVHVNLLKDMDDVQKFLQANHPFTDDLKFVENDFSKYDKSQDEFVFKLEKYVFEQLGMNKAFLNRWVTGHEECRITSFTTGLSLHLRYQRKSGDATTSFGNVMLNILSVSYAYGITDFAWALFMGDDSLFATHGMVIDERAVNMLAEVFNLTAKTFITEQPYFASWFFMFVKESRRVIGLPDPIKRVEKWSQAISSAPFKSQDEEYKFWASMHESAALTCKAYSSKANTRWLGHMVSKRYMMDVKMAARLAPAIFTAVSSVDKFRAMYEDKPEIFHV